MRCSVVYWLLVTVVATTLEAQAPASPTCADSIAKSMAFLQGSGRAVATVSPAAIPHSML
jgi:hypothetical protein